MGRNLSVFPHTVIRETQAKISVHKGPEIAAQVIADAFERARLSAQDSYTAQQLLGFSDGLITHGGYVELLGRMLKMKALLAGAQVSPDASK